MSAYSGGYCKVIKTAGLGKAASPYPVRLSERLWHDLSPRARATLGGGVGGAAVGGVGGAAVDVGGGGEGNSTLQSALIGALAGSSVGSVGGRIRRALNPIRPTKEGLPGRFLNVPVSLGVRTMNHDYTRVTNPNRVGSTLNADGNSSLGAIFDLDGTGGLSKVERRNWQLQNVPEHLRDSLDTHDASNRAIRIIPGLDVPTSRGTLGGKAVVSPETLRSLYQNNELRDTAAQRINDFYRGRGRDFFPTAATEHVDRVGLLNADIGYYGSLRHNTELSSSDNEMRRVLRTKLRSGDIDGTYHKKDDVFYIPGRVFNGLLPDRSPMASTAR